MNIYRGEKINWIMLFVGAAAFVFSSGRWNLFITAWIWPFAFLYFSRKADNKENFLLLLAVIELVQQIKWYNILGTKSIVDALFCLAWSTGWILPFIADKLFAEKFSGSFMRSLVFPSVFTMLEIVRSFTPAGAYSAMAYSQGPFRLLTQIVSVIGSYGLSFLIFWFASVIVGITEKKGGWKLLTGAYAVIMAGVLCFGGIRLSASQVNTDKTVKVASIINQFHGSLDKGGYTDLTYEETESYLVSEVKRAAEGKAEIACWGEEAWDIKDTDEARLLETAKSLASGYDMILVIGYKTSDTDESENGLFTDKLAIVLPDGSVTEYIKSHLVPLIETSEFVSGPGTIPTAVTEKGIISAIICFDDCYPGFVRGAGAITGKQFKDTEILFVPSWDWSAVTNAHSDLSVFRAIENGESVVKVTYDGVSISADHLGRVIKKFDTKDTGFDTVQFADVPVKSVHTVYSRYGTFIDVFWFLLGIAAVFAGIAKSVNSKNY